MSDLLTQLDHARMIGVGYRKKLKINQTTLAKKLGITQSRFSSIERAPIGTLELGTLARYLEAVGIQITVTVTHRETT